MEQVTIEGILDRPLLQLVKDAPANRMTRGQVRAATNLVLPDGVDTSEGIIEYVLENYDKDNAPKQDWHEERQRETDMQATREAQRLRRETVDAERRRLDAEAMFVVECEASEVRIYDTVESYRGTYNTRMRFQPRNFDGCGTKAEVIEMMEDKVKEQMWDEGISDEDHIDTHDSEFRDSQDFEHETSFETIWDQNKEAIAAHLGTTPEEME
jgi:hypothetical protein